MKKNSKIDKNEKEINLEENKDSKKKKIVILVIAIFILSLITTGLTTNIFGRIGTAFRNEGDFVLKHTADNDKEIIRNRELKFDSSSLKMSLSDTSGKLSYSRERVILENFTCETEDAKVATCYPADGYVVVYPKNEGKTKVILRGEANGKIYMATATVEVGEAERYIELASYNGTINLYSNKTKDVAYYLVGMKGNVKATSSNESVAKVTASKGTLKIEASKVGKTDITVSIDYNDRTYTSVYHLEVINESNKNTDDSDKPVTRVKSRVSTLSKLTVSNGKLDFIPGTTNYSVMVDEDVKTVDIDFEKTNKNARVIYTIDGIASTSLKNIPLREGAREVTITVISEDGSSTTVYTIAINRVDSEIKNSITSISLNGMVLSATAPTYYSVRVANDVEAIDLDLSFSGDVANVRYVVGNTVNTDGSILKNFSLKLGKNTIKIIVTNKYGISMICFVTIEREAPSSDTSIHLDLLDEGYELVQDDDNHYSIDDIPYEKDKFSLSAACVNDECKSITYEIEYEDGTKKKLDDLNNVPLKEGNNKIIITVTAADDTVGKHYVNIYRPVRIIEFENDTNVVLVDKDYTDIPYTIKEIDKDGNETVIDIDNASEVIKASLKDYNDDATLEVYQGYVRVIPKNHENLLKGEEDTLKLNYNGKDNNTTVTFDIDDIYTLTSGSDTYDMSNSKASKTRAIILNTNLVQFTDSEIVIEKSEDGKKLTICDKEKVHCVIATVDSENDEGNITLSYGSDSKLEIGPDDLPITITANGDGVSKIKVIGTVYGKPIEDELDLTITVTRKYLITIYANFPGEEGGKFNITSAVWTDEISKNQAFNLLAIPEPYREVECKFYRFEHYTDDKNDKTKEAYNRSTLSIIMGANLTDDLDLYAVYSDKESPKRIPITNSIWLNAQTSENPDAEYVWTKDEFYTKGLPLFHNEEYYTKYNEDKVIYPTAQGSYVMNFTAADDLILTGMVLKEENICVEEGKCLNMAYSIRYNEIKSNGVWSEQMKLLDGDKVKADGNYWILNKNRGIMDEEVTYIDEYNQKDVFPDNDDVFTDNRADITFEEPISLLAGDQISITIFWKWVEVDDTVDTAIGEYAALKEEDSSINDLYRLYVGLVYQPDDSCKVNG